MSTRFEIYLGAKLCKIEYVTDKAEAEQILYTLPADKLYGIDIETYPKREYLDALQGGLCPHLSVIRLMQIGTSEAAYVFDLLKMGGMPEMMRVRNLNFVAHSAIFEIKHLHHAGLKHINNIHCSMIQAMIVDAAEHSQFEKDITDDDYDSDDREPDWKGYGLQACSGRTLGLNISKDMQVSDWSAKILSEEQITYAGLDAILTCRLHTYLMPRIEMYKMGTVYNLYKAMQYVVAEMESVGMGYDENQHIKLIKEWEHDRTSSESECRRFFGELNLNSSAQLGKWLTKLCTERGKTETLEAWPKTKTGKLSFGRKSLVKFGSVGWVKALLEYKRVEKQLNTYGHKLRARRNPCTGRIHSGYSVGRTATGRLSSYNPNLQNMQRDSKLRDVFAAASGNCLTVADFSQIEIRVACEVSGDPTMRTAFETSQDLHKAIVSALTGKPTTSVTKQDRQLGKAVNFGLLFGMGPAKLRVHAETDYGVPMTEAEAKTAYQVFHKERYPKYSAWSKSQRDMAKELQYVRTPLGKMRKLAESEYYTKSVNTPVQGGAAEVNMIACVMVQQALRAKKIKGVLINSVHDELIVEHAESETETVSSLLKHCMAEAMRTVFKTAPLKGIAEVGTGKTWLEAKANAK